MNESQTKAFLFTEKVVKFIKQNGYCVVHLSKDEYGQEDKETRIGIVIAHPELSKIELDDLFPGAIISFILGALTFALTFFFTIHFTITHAFITGVSVSTTAFLFAWTLTKWGNRVEVRLGNLHTFTELPCQDPNTQWKFEVFGDGLMHLAEKLANKLRKKYQVGIVVELASPSFKKFNPPVNLM